MNQMSGTVIKSVASKAHDLDNALTCTHGPGLQPVAPEAREVRSSMLTEKSDGIHCE
jgi:hypothetical protein